MAWPRISTTYFNPYREAFPYLHFARGEGPDTPGMFLIGEFVYAPDPGHAQAFQASPWTSQIRLPYQLGRAQRPLRFVPDARGRQASSST